MAHYRNPHTVTLYEPPTSTENPHCQKLPKREKIDEILATFSTLWHFLVTFGQFLYLYLASFCIIKAISDNPKAKCHKYNGYPWISKKTFLM